MAPICDLYILDYSYVGLSFVSFNIPTNSFFHQLLFNLIFDFGLLTCHHQQAFVVTSMPKRFTTLELQSPS
jgi:hypothetical protein